MSFGGKTTMAACDHPKPLPLESWKQVKSVDQYSFTEIFGQLYLKDDINHVLDSPESSSPPSSPSSTITSISTAMFHGDDKKQHRRDSISSANSSTCTDELGFESSDNDIDQDLMHDWHANPRTTKCKNKRHSRRNLGHFPPPISSIGRNGKPGVCFKSVREGGRFILTEIRVPTQEFLHACRKNGRLKMQFVLSDDELVDEEDEDEGTSEIEDGAV